MSTLYLAADAWDALTPEEQQTARDEANTPVCFGIPAVWYGDFDVDGTFVHANATTPDVTAPAPPADPPVATRWYAWDDHRLTEAHAIALAVAVEGIV